MVSPAITTGRLTRSRAAELGIEPIPAQELPGRRPGGARSAAPAIPSVDHDDRLVSEREPLPDTAREPVSVPVSQPQMGNPTPLPQPAAMPATGALASEDPANRASPAVLTTQLTELNRLLSRVAAQRELCPTFATPSHPTPRYYAQGDVEERLESRVARLSADIEARVITQVQDKLAKEHSRYHEELMGENGALQRRLDAAETELSQLKQRLLVQTSLLREVQQEVFRSQALPRKAEHKAVSSSRRQAKKDQSSASDDDEFHTAQDRVVKQRLQYSSDNSDESRPSRGDFRLRLGPKQRGLSELQCSDRLFQPIISYRKYRLRITDQVIDDQITANTGLNIRRLDHTMKNRKFSGSEPLRVLNFLNLFKAQCDSNGISEGGALLLLPNFLDGEAYELFMSNQDLGEECTGGFATYPEAVQFLLRTYAREAYIETAVEEFDRLAQKSDETELDYSRRLREANRKLGSAYPEEELIRRFIRGLDPTIKPLLARAARTKPFNSLISAAEYAATHGDSHRAHRATMKPVSPRAERSILRSGGRGVTAIETDAVNLLETRNDLQTLGESDQGTQLALADAFAAGMQFTQPDIDVNAVVHGEHSRLPSFARPTRQQKPGWVDHDAPNAICFECFAKGHIRPSCPHLARQRDMETETKFQRLRENNFCLLQEKDRDVLRSQKRNPFAPSEPPTRPPSVSFSNEKTPLEEESKN